MNVVYRLVLFLIIVVNGHIFAGNGTQPSMMQNIYSGAVAQLGYAQRALAHFFSREEKEEEIISKKITTTQASLLVQRIIDEKPRDKAAQEKYWKSRSSLLLRHARILYDASVSQILKTLQEIDKRLMYWLHQREHQWEYFFGKNPLKWIMGKSQDVEITTNIDQLRSKQNELYIRLAELSRIDWHEYLMAFNNDQLSYEWIEKLFAILSGDKVQVVSQPHEIQYEAIVIQLRDELKKVSTLADSILASISDTEMPYHITRKWVRYGGLLMASYLAYGNETITSLFAPQAMAGYQASMGRYWQEEVMPPVKNIVEKIFFRSRTNAERQSLQNSLSTLLSKIAPQQKKAIMDAEKIGNLVPLQEFFNSMDKAAWRFVSKGDIAQVSSLFTQLKAYHFIDAFSVLLNIALLTPASLAGLGIYHGYKKLTTYDYTPMRLALIAINSLFVDTTKSLDDLEYGKMIYLLYNLKEKAKRELQGRGNVRDDFIKDLERIESREFDSAAKRRIIEDMFRKYSFLGLIQ